MTFSLILRDPETGEFGSAISSSSPAVAARCVNLADRVGGAHSQNVTDPRLGPQLIAQLRQGKPAQAAIDAVLAETTPDTREFRQLLVLDAAGRSAVYSGGNSLGIFGETLRENAVAGGNMLAHRDVLDTLVDTALSATGSMEERLMAALHAAIAAGGEAGPVHSAGISVVGSAGWRITDLRVDWADDDPIGELGRLVEVWMPQRDAYVGRALNPAIAPSYGVPGDE